MTDHLTLVAEAAESGALTLLQQHAAAIEANDLHSALAHATAAKTLAVLAVEIRNRQRGHLAISAHAETDEAPQ